MKSCENCRYRKIDEDCLPCSACIDLVSDLSGWVGLTNADRIRGMSDEELAKWLCVMNFDDCPDRAHQMKCTDKCYECWLDWLKSPAEEGEG